MSWFDEQIKTRIRKDQESLESAFVHLSSVVMGESVVRAALKNEREKAKSLIRTDCGFEAYATDIRQDCVDIAAAAAERAGVGGMINCFVMDALDIDTMGRRGTIVTNPPYGERLLTVEEAEELYRAMGTAFAGLGAWQIYVITQSERFPQLYGRRADKIRKLYNGMIPCYYYQYFKNPASGKK